MFQLLIRQYNCNIKYMNNSSIFSIFILTFYINTDPRQVLQEKWIKWIFLIVLIKCNRNLKFMINRLSSQF